MTSSHHRRVGSLRPILNAAMVVVEKRTMVIGHCYLALVYQAMLIPARLEHAAVYVNLFTWNRFSIERLQVLAPLWFFPLLSIVWIIAACLAIEAHSYWHLAPTEEAADTILWVNCMYLMERLR